MEKLLGRNARVLDEASRRLQEEREAGIRPPFKAGLPDEMRTSDPFLNRVIRSILARRAKMRELQEKKGRMLQP